MAKRINMPHGSLVPGSAICSLVSLAVLAFTAQADSSMYSAPPSIDTPVNLPSAALSTVCERPDERTLDAIVQVATDHGSRASGVVFDDNRVLTAAHAIQGAGQFFVHVEGGYRSADLIMVDHTHDLAVLAVNTAWIEPLVISGFNSIQSATVWAAGYPRAQAMKMSAGVFTQVNDTTLYTSATIDSGQSGGGLLSCSRGRWSLAGMLRGYGAYLQGDHYVKLENHSVSVAGTTINDFLLNYQ